MIMPACRVVVVVIVAMTRLMPGIKDMNPPAMTLIIMGMVNMAVAIRARLGLKTLVHFGNRPAQALDHGLEHMIGQQTQPARTHLHRHMPVAHMVGNSGQLRGVSGAHFHQSLGCGLDRNHPAVLEQQTITVAQQGAMGQIHADFLAADQFGPKTRALSLLETQLENLVNRSMSVSALGGHLEGHDKNSEYQTPYQNRK